MGCEMRRSGFAVIAILYACRVQLEYAATPVRIDACMALGF
jgi:hypothetical protein